MSRSRRAFTTFLVLWAIAVAAVVLASLQSGAFRQAAAGREAVARVRAYWAARAGIEAQVAALTFNTVSPDAGSAYTVTDDMLGISRGSLSLASYDTRHTRYPEERDGPEDAHAKININTMTREDMLLLPDMDETIADSLIDWTDEDDDPEEFGAEAGQYQSQRAPYVPRNAPFRSLQELELVLGVRPEFVRGEDWNLNGRLDPNEDDGDLSPPADNADGKLDAGWSEHVTVVSEDGGLAASGQPRLDLTVADSEEIARRLGVDRTQADTIAEYATDPGASLVDFINNDLASMASSGGGGGTLLNGQGAAVAPLTREQLGVLLDECSMGPDGFNGPRGGRININTVDRSTLDYLADLSPAVADALILERDSRAGGFTTLADLLEVPSVTEDVLADLYQFFDVRSNVYVVSCRGRDDPTGLEVEIVATIDRTTIPVLIKDLVVR